MHTHKVKILLYCNHENGGCTLYLIVVNLGQVASREKKKPRVDEQMIVHTHTKLHYIFLLLAW